MTPPRAFADPHQGPTWPRQGGRQQQWNRYWENDWNEKVWKKLWKTREIYEENKL